MSMAGLVVPGVSKRTDFPLNADRCALLVIDIQKYLSIPRTPEEASEKAYFFKEACPAAMQNIIKLIDVFKLIRDDAAGRKTGMEIIFTYLQSSTLDGRDISLDYKLSGPDLTNIPRVGTALDQIFLEGVSPDIVTGKGDILLPKTSCNVFVSTNLDYLLRNLGIEQIVVVGQLTDECVESAVRTGADLGYLMTVVEDACASLTPEKHQKGLDGVKGFARILKTSQMMDEVIEGLSSQVNGSLKGRLVPSDGVSDETVLSYLRSRGLHKMAKQLDLMFTIQGIAKREKKDDMNKKKEDEARSPRRRLRRSNRQRNGVECTDDEASRGDMENSFTVDDLVGVKSSPKGADDSATIATTTTTTGTNNEGMPPPPPLAGKSPKRSHNKSKKFNESEQRVAAV